SIIGSLWLMSLLGADVGFLHGSFPLHRTFQIDGFLTLLVMGVGYMIVPRFRNIQLPSIWLVYLSFILILFSIAASILSTFTTITLSVIGVFAQFLSVSIFAGITIWTLRTPPRLLRTADYFIALSVTVLLSTNVLEVIHQVGSRNGSSLSEVQMILFFAILMILGVEFKTLPSFLGFIRPRKKLSALSFWLAFTSVIFGLASVLYHEFILGEIFNAVLLGFVMTFAAAIYIFGGFDNREILSLIQGEKKARYKYTVRHLRLSFLFLYGGIILALAFNITSSYILYDLAIHYTAIGFIGFTVALYLPLMLPPITGKMVDFMKFNNLPLYFILAALGTRTLGDIVMTTRVSTVPTSYLSMISGWLVVLGLFGFITMIHRSMNETETINNRNN
ncbi:MAG: hypothetical protein M3258_08325, partial [Thermoproteota archaeon]|nr:hypothetical protein [Thermoproteota archaeon]